MDAVKKGLRRKWQATVKDRTEPAPAERSADDEWKEQWKKLWRDIEGGDDWEALIEPIGQHDKLLSECSDLLVEAIEKILFPIDYAIITPTAAATASEEHEEEHGDQAKKEEGEKKTARVTPKKLAAQPTVVFSGYRERVLEAARERFNTLRRLNVTFCRSLAKRVRAERGVTPDEFAQQRAFLMQEHAKQLDSVRIESQVYLQEEKHKINWQKEQERIKLQDQLDAELAAAEEASLSARTTLEKTIQDASDAKVKDLEDRLAVAMKRLADGDFDLLKSLSASRYKFQRQSHFQFVKTRVCDGADFREYLQRLDRAAEGGERGP